MPLRRLLEGGNFGPEAIAILLESFDEAVADLDLRSDLDRNKAARIIIRLAHRQATLDARKLRDEVVRLMRKDGIGRRRPF